MLIEAGKFDRGLARRLPAVLPRGASVLEIGAAAGFLGLHLSRVRPDLTLTLQEENLSLRTTLQRIMAQNDRSFGPRLSLLPIPLGNVPARTVIQLAADAKPVTLLLADPQLTPAVLIDLLPRLRSPQPDQILLYGRLLEWHHGALAPVEELLVELGYQPGLGFDPNIARGFLLADDDTPSPT